MSVSPFLLAGLLLCGVVAPILEDAPPVQAQEQAAPQQKAEPSPPSPAPAAPSSSAAAGAAATPAPAAAEAPIPAAAAALVNPVHPTAASRARALQIYGYDCEMCHGKGGDGVSEIDAKTKLHDYRDPASLKGLTDGQIFYIIENGRGAMPGEGPRAKPDEVWNLVIYLRSLSKGKSAAPAHVGVRSSR